MADFVQVHGRIGKRIKEVEFMGGKKGLRPGKAEDNVENRPVVNAGPFDGYCHFFLTPVFQLLQNGKCIRKIIA
ncbi:MAG: hypothetical protein ACYDBT_13700 [Desulfobulbaceae bacterium]